ncbi:MULTISPECIES: GNAT family N-acetyltransferase [Cellulomonas]|uniref:N-acetyltransferase GCN5 n=1 Tax=Cellulomonas oligotrophica TaxID=931536 RepID=A0ABQ4DCE6_9CELL|nr:MULTISPECIES: GNAT family protein [Cellulomonas]TQL01385.1 aminoglycoside 6'-N-acetyltransferase [Cellulomonas sp. SLBN-39]GIG33375.1 N-acetyltransferase GCN5 [Cellulomonas oligotrophica]
MTTEVQLRAVVEQDLATFEAALSSREGTGEFQWFGFTSFHGVRRRFAEDGLIGPDGGVLTVTCGGDCAGRVEWFPSAWGRPATSTCWTLAIAILPVWRGQGIGTAAQALLVDHLFSSTRVERVQAFTDVDNVPERRALERCGFTLEGVLRRAQWRDGGWHDQALYSVLRPKDPQVP